MLTMAIVSAKVSGYGAGGLGLVSAVIAQATQESHPPVATGAMALGFASIIAAAGPHLMSAFKMWIEDRRDERATSLIEIVNLYNRDHARLRQLEQIAAKSDELKAITRMTETRLVEARDRIDWLEEYVAHLLPAIVDNQVDLGRVSEGWKSANPPSLKAATDPTPIPPAMPPSKSGSNLRLPVVADPAAPKPAPTPKSSPGSEAPQ